MQGRYRWLIVIVAFMAVGCAGGDSVSEDRPWVEDTEDACGLFLQVNGAEWRQCVNTYVDRTEFSRATHDALNEKLAQDQIESAESVGQEIDADVVTEPLSTEWEPPTRCETAFLVIESFLSLELAVRLGVDLGDATAMLEVVNQVRDDASQQARLFGFCGDS